MIGKYVKSQGLKYGSVGIFVCEADLMLAEVQRFSGF